MDTSIIPILIFKKGLLTDKNNYRPVAMTPLFSTIVESSIIVKYRDILGSLITSWLLSLVIA